MKNNPCHCPHCTTALPVKLARTARFCPFCGKGLCEEKEGQEHEAETASAAAPASGQQTPKGSKQQQKKKKGATSPADTDDKGGDAISSAPASDIASAFPPTPTPMHPPTATHDQRLAQLEPWQRAFIQSLEESPSVMLACRVGEVSREAAYQTRESSALFRALWEEAVELHSDKVEASLYEVATAGHAKTHVNRKGEVVTERVRDVTAMKLWLTGNRPRLYRDTHRTEVAHALAPEIGTILREVRMRRQAGASALGTATAAPRDLPATAGSVENEESAEMNEPHETAEE